MTKPDFQLVEARPSEECGCPEEVWIMRNLEVLIHIEPSGSGEMFIDAGDWEDEKHFECTGIDDLRAKAIAYVSSIPVEP